MIKVFFQRCVKKIKKMYSGRLKEKRIEYIDNKKVSFVCHDEKFRAIIDGGRIIHENYDDWVRLQELKGKPDWFDKNWELTRDKQKRQWDFAEIEPGIRMLEVGFRDGFNLLYLKEKEIEIVGIEVNKYAILHATSLGCESYLEDIQRKTHFNAKYFDLISACDVLEHCFNPEKAMREMYRILSDNGRLVIEIPFENEFNENLVHGHSFLFYNLSSAQKFFNDNLFDIIKKDTSDISRNLFLLKKRQLNR